jgi:hypothetical protein
MICPVYHRRRNQNVRWLGGGADVSYSLVLMVEIKILWQAGNKLR